jgi:hypothetical protein
MIESALLGSGLGGQGGEPFGRCETFCPFRNHHVSFLEPVHGFDADQRALVVHHTDYDG